MLNEVYNRRILELAGGIPRLGRLDQPDASATAHSKLCGSTVTVDPHNLEWAVAVASGFSSRPNRGIPPASSRIRRL